MDHGELMAYARRFFAAFDGDPVPSPLELAHHLVFGAVEYARSLGFPPHHDVAAAAAHLGAWTGPADITFGRDGKPFYMQGPYDNVVTVIQTLDRTIGRGNYHYLAAVP
jgi:hypothetical protein